ncbi:hypothetical protein ACVWYG_002620 [Pedobacter sp. UYEF25]
MENNEQTRAKLAEYLTPLTRYSETNDEVFDHVLKAAELSDEPFSENFASKIIEQDLGGLTGIQNMETEAIRAIYRKVNKIYWEEFKNQFFRRDLANIIISGGLTFLFMRPAIGTSSIFLPIYVCGSIIWLGISVCYLMRKSLAGIVIKEPLCRKLLLSKSIKSSRFIIFFMCPILQDLAGISALTFALIFITSALIFFAHLRVFIKFYKSNLQLKTA